MLDDNKLFSFTSAPGFYKVFDKLDFGEIHVFQDKESQLLAIVAIHSTKLGPSLGGCRFVEYDSIDDAMIDVIRLARGMSYKAAISKLPLGGGKAVVIKPKKIENREKLFSAFGKFVDSLNGRYITAEDSGTKVADMDVISKVTKHVVGHSGQPFATKDPSPLTALGVKYGIEAAVKFKLNKDSLKDLHIAINGVGNVGYNLAKECHAKGARLTISDINQEALEKCQREFDAQVVAPETISTIKCDVYAPCALSNAINSENIDKLQTSIIAGAANNQLEKPKLAEILLQKGILYAPDYVINAGGLIHVASQCQGLTEADSLAQIENIYNTLMEIFNESVTQNLPTSVIADNIAYARLK